LSQWFFTSDLHGHGVLYEQTLALVAARGARAVILGGDLGPHAGGAEGVRTQRVFLQGFLVEFARRLREASPGVTLLLLMGNDDWSANLDCLEAHHGDLWQMIHGRAVSVDGVAVAGLSWVPITPFALKDWERWEDGEEETPARTEGWISRNGGVEPCRFDASQRAPTIAGALAELVQQTAPPDTVFVLHSPPHGTRCDMIAPGQHVGSRAIRSFVERHAPRLVLSGHIHESPRVSGAWRDRIGPSEVVNPGQFGTSRLCGVWFDPGRPGETLRHTVHP
jgi:Icc-related predicted phosphoesterase